MKIAVLFGGNSSERDVSVASGVQVARGLQEAGHEVLAFDTARGALSSAEQQRLLANGVAPLPPALENLPASAATCARAVSSAAMAARPRAYPLDGFP